MSERDRLKRRLTGGRGMSTAARTNPFSDKPRAEGYRQGVVHGMMYSAVF